MWRINESCSKDEIASCKKSQPWSPLHRNPRIFCTGGRALRPCFWEYRTTRTCNCREIPYQWRCEWDADSRGGFVRRLTFMDSPVTFYVLKLPHFPNNIKDTPSQVEVIGRAANMLHEAFSQRLYYWARQFEKFSFDVEGVCDTSYSTVERHRREEGGSHIIAKARSRKSG